MRIPFTKMEGAGNDFLVLDARTNQSDGEGKLAGHLDIPTIQRLSHRRTGIGFDQLLLIARPNEPANAISYRVFNADGSEVQQCGNGARALGAYLANQFRRQPDNGTKNIPEFSMESMSGLVIARPLESGQVSVNMGVPDFDPAALPFLAIARATEYVLDINQQSIEFGAVSMGNPHVTMVVEELCNVAIEPIALGFQTHPSFPESVNVGFMQIDSRHQIRLRVYERGVGETLACGTGACAAMAIGHTLGLLSNKVSILAAGGKLLVTWAGEGQNSWLTGDCRQVYEGHIDL